LTASSSSGVHVAFGLEIMKLTFPKSHRILIKTPSILHR